MAIKRTTAPLPENRRKPQKTKFTETEDDDGRHTNARGVVREGVWRYGVLGGKKRLK